VWIFIFTGRDVMGVAIDRTTDVMCRDFEICERSCDGSAPSRARRFVAGSLRSELSGPAAEGPIELTVLVVSELVTNAVRAGCAAIGITLQLHRDHLRVVVFDDAPGRPKQRIPGPDDVRGRGLSIVRAVSRAWGLQAAAAGKRLWAEIALPDEVIHASACFL
jgi:anti-sigma regulatory factor (Ser/Thr protein kinase)